jgi:hypothetical protein
MHIDGISTRTKLPFSNLWCVTHGSHGFLFSFAELMCSVSLVCYPKTAALSGTGEPRRKTNKSGKQQVHAGYASMAAEGFGLVITEDPVWMMIPQAESSPQPKGEL